MLRERLEAIVASIPGAVNVGYSAAADEAIAAIPAARADVVVLDFQLERGSGFDVMRALRESAPALRFYVLTNFAHEAYRRKAQELGARGFFDKSREVDLLREALAAESG